MERMNIDLDPTKTCPNRNCGKPIASHKIDELRTCLTEIAIGAVRITPAAKPPLPEGTAKKVEISSPETDPVMYTAKDHLGVESLTKPFTYRGMRFGIGDHVEDVQRQMNKREAEIAAR